MRELSSNGIVVRTEGFGSDNEQRLAEVLEITKFDVTVQFVDGPEWSIGRFAHRWPYTCIVVSTDEIFGEPS